MALSETTTATAPRFELQASRSVAAFLADQGASIACTTYQAGKLLLLGTKPDRSLAVFDARRRAAWASRYHRGGWMSRR